MGRSHALHASGLEVNFAVPLSDRLERQDESECGVHRAQLFEAQVAGSRPETLWVHRGGLLDEHPRRPVADPHLWTKTRSL